MARGALKVLECDYVIATSGIAGPNGATNDKPVGTIWIAIADINQIVSECFQFGKIREQNIQLATNKSLLLMMDFLRKKS